MKAKRQSKIIELIQKYEIETQEELSGYLQQEGFQVTQATVSRDMRELKLTKVAAGGGRQKYVILGNEKNDRMNSKYARVLREGFLSMDMAQNILVVRTVSGMASAVCAAIDALDFSEIVGSIAGDDTIMCAVRSVEETEALIKKLRKIIDAE